MMTDTISPLFYANRLTEVMAKALRRQDNKSHGM